MPIKDTKILEFNQYLKSDKMSYITYADVDNLFKKIDGFKSKPEKSSTSKIGENTPCGYSVSTTWAFHGIENKYNVCRGKDCINKFWESLI